MEAPTLAQAQELDRELREWAGQQPWCKAINWLWERGIHEPSAALIEATIQYLAPTQKVGDGDATRNNV